jgi:hypothetical protein
MSAVKYDLELEAGASFAVTFTYLQADGVTPVPLTGWTARAMIRTSAQDTSVEPLVDVAPTINTGTGEVALNLTAAQTRAALGGNAWALELTASGGEPVVRLAHGKVLVSPEVVHD